MSRINLLFLTITLLVANQLQAEGVVDAHLKAIGGKDAIAKIKTVQRTGTFSATGSYPFAGTFEEMADLSKRYVYSRSESQVFTRESAWTGKSGWVNDPNVGVTELPEPEAFMTKLGGGPSLLASFHDEHGDDALKEQGEREFNGQACVVLASSVTPLEFYINAETNLLEGASLRGFLDATYEDYGPFDGVQFPNKLSIKLVTANMTIVYDYKKTLINGKLDEKRFRRPSSPDKERSAPSQTPTIEQLIRTMDTNRDGKISKSEASEDLRLFFADYDKNGDGVIDAKEAEPMLAYVDNATAETKSTQTVITAEQMIAYMDTDGDGLVGKGEASDQLKPYFDQFDTDKNGFIDVKEAGVLAVYAGQQENAPQESAPKKTQVTAQQIVSYMDTNRDGKISKDEASEDLKPNFDYIDTNGDGVIDMKEAEVIAKYANG